MEVFYTLEDVKLIQALSIMPDFEWAVFADETGDGDDVDQFDMPKYWNLKRKRNGYKGRSPKHPLNVKKKKRISHHPKPSAC